MSGSKKPKTGEKNMLTNGAHHDYLGRTIYPADNPHVVKPNPPAQKLRDAWDDPRATQAAILMDLARIR
jgi:hypothetical protein